MVNRWCGAWLICVAACTVDNVHFSAGASDAGSDASPPPPPPPSTLAVAKLGEGVVTSSPAGLDCGAICSAVFPSGTSVTLTAEPSRGWAFVGWSRLCAGVEPCTFTLDGATNLAATFLPRSIAFTASGDFTVPPGVSSVHVLLIGGGGGGANGHQGGGGAGFVTTAQLNVTPGDVVPVVVGAGGLGAAACDNCNDILGNTAGGSSSYGALVVTGGNTPGVVNGPGASGGSGGGGSCNAGPIGGAGGAGGAGGGACSYEGGAGQGSYAASLAALVQRTLSAGPGGAGGMASHAGGGGAGGIFLDGTGPAAFDGANPTFSAKGGKGYGAGGGAGSYDGSGTLRFAGGNGAPGLVYIEW
ncbi:MAG: hypothetical protein R3B48_22615 [Kofleriaceae bacterium]